MKKQHADIRNCLESWEEELQSRAKRVRRLIGDRHWLSDGTHKESLVTEFLKRHLPSDLSFSKGFIVTGDSHEKPSKEIDILIASYLVDSPWFSEGDLAIVPPRSCLAQIHVKTEFDVPELTDVFSSCDHSAKLAGKSAESCFFGAVFFERSKVREDSKFQRIIKNSIGSAKHLPDVIAILDGPIIVKKHRQLSGYTGNRLSLAILLTQLRQRIAENLNQKSESGEISVFLERLNYQQIF